MYEFLLLVAATAKANIIMQDMNEMHMNHARDVLADAHDAQLLAIPQDQWHVWPMPPWCAMVKTYYAIAYNAVG